MAVAKPFVPTLNPIMEDEMEIVSTEYVTNTDTSLFLDAKNEEYFSEDGDYYGADHDYDYDHGYDLEIAEFVLECNYMEEADALEEYKIWYSECGHFD